jgi:protocatechuate 3,4-dioxygenase alpha subunit
MQLKQTPSQTVGPFFHYGLVDHGGENILVNDDTRGKRILLKGQVTDGSGTPVSDAMLEIWQADESGAFNHPEDPHHAQADPNFTGFGRAPTNKNGIFTFKTIKPGVVPYDDSTPQAPHVNVRVFSRGMLIHAYTRLYFGDEPEANAADPVLNMVPPERRHTLIALPEEHGDLTTYCFNIALQGDNETIFFEP